MKSPGFSLLPTKGQSRKKTSTPKEDRRWVGDDDDEEEDDDDDTPIRRCRTINQRRSWNSTSVDDDIILLFPFLPLQLLLALGFSRERDKQKEKENENGRERKKGRLLSNKGREERRSWIFRWIWKKEREGVAGNEGKSFDFWLGRERGKETEEFEIIKK